MEAEGSSHDAEDLRLLKRYSDGSDREAVGELLKRHMNSAFGLATKYLRSQTDAMDAVQIAFVKAMNRAETFRGDSSVKSWLLGIVVNVCREIARREARRMKREDTAAVLQTRSRDDERAKSASEEIRDAMRSAIDLLPEQYRLPVWMHYCADLPASDAAATLALSDTAFRQRLSRGVARLRSAMEGMGYSLAIDGIISVARTIEMPAAPLHLSQHLVQLVNHPNPLAAETELLAKASLAHTAHTAVVKVAVCLAVLGTLGGGAFVVQKAFFSGDNTRPQPPIIAAPAQSVPGSPAGWRGDGTGHFPDADPPLEWRYAPIGPMNDIRSLAGKPGANSAADAHPMADGIIVDWLVLGPFDEVKDQSPLDRAYVQDEASLMPDAGQAVGSLKWQKWTLRRSDRQATTYPLDMVTPWRTIAWEGPFGNFTGKVGYAATYIYCRNGGDLGLNLQGSGFRLWVNGKAVASDNKAGGPVGIDVPMQSGWNRLLFKGTKNFSIRLAPARNAQYEKHNVRWATKMPDFSYSSPIAVGNRVFTTAEAFTLLCLDRSSGEILWTRKNYRYMTADPEEMNSSQWKETVAPLTNRDETCWQADKNLEKINGKKYALGNQGTRSGYSSMTPASNGKLVVAAFGNGVVACYDLEGRTRWIRMHPYPAMQAAGNTVSPIICGSSVVVHRGFPAAFDLETGRELWREPDALTFLYGSPVRTEINKQAGVILPNGLVFEPVTGRLLAVLDGFGTWAWCWSPVRDRDTVISLEGMPDKRIMVAVRQPSAASDKPATRIFRTKVDYGVSSPLCHEGVVYAVSSAGLLTTVDAATGGILATQQLAGLYPDFNISPASIGVTASIVLTGKHLLIMDNHGWTAVVEPGRKPKQVATCRLSGYDYNHTIGNFPEHFFGSPFVDGDSIFIRGTCRLYHIARSGN